MTNNKIAYREYIQIYLNIYCENVSEFFQSWGNPTVRRGKPGSVKYKI